MLEIKNSKHIQVNSAFVPEFTIVGVNIDLTHGPCEVGHFSLEPEPDPSSL
jgi:hypothetical protein